MTAFLWIVVWLAALALGIFVTAFARLEERRWATVGSIVLALIGALGLGVITQWGSHPVTIGPFLVDAIPTTVAPAMLLGALCLVLIAGRKEASGRESAWLLTTLVFESIALLSGSFALLLVAEIGATSVLAYHAMRRNHRAHLFYLSVVSALLVASLGIWLAIGNISVLPVLVIIAALLRLGVFPLSTGMLASLQHGPTMSTLLASLPFGGVLLLIRANPMLADYPEITTVLIDFLLVSAPLAAALSISQRQLGRSFGYVLAATHALIALGALDPSASGQTGAELLWAGAVLTGAGFGGAATLVHLRIGDPDLDDNHGLHSNAPTLSLAFLILGVGMAGAPGTIEFVAEDILINTASAEGTLGMGLVIATIAIIGFNVLRLHFRLFFGSSPASRPYLQIKGRERMGLGLVGAVIILAGVAPSIMPLVSAAASAAGAH